MSHLSLTKLSFDSDSDNVERQFEDEERLASQRRSPKASRWVWYFLATVVAVLVIGVGLINLTPSRQRITSPTESHLHSSHVNTSDTTLHVVIPTNRGDVNLCKLLLGAAVLGYPTPTLLAWEESFDREGILGGGSHLAKVQKVLEYLESLGPEQQGDLLLMLDAYDIHLQLPKSTLIDRFYTVQTMAQNRIDKFLGPETTSTENLSQTVLFGSGKRCAPNQPHTVACYAIPDSPLPTDLYGVMTDTIIGHNHFYSNRQRFLNSGYIMGSVADLKKVFKEAWHLIQTHPDADPLDDGSHGSDFMYHGSDQSIFAAMYGRQEWSREKLRLKHHPGAQPRSSQIMNTPIDNVLSPAFPHEEIDFDLSNGNPYEFGIFLDYWSDIGHQTINSEEDAHWIVYSDFESRPAEEQIGPRMMFDCPIRMPSGIPQDILSARLLSDPHDDELWEDRPLYTHVCLSTIPVLVHMNGIKEHREQRWPNLWYQPQSRAMLKDLERSLHDKLPSPDYESFKRHPTAELAGGVWTDKGTMLRWSNICPPEWHHELFRD